METQFHCHDFIELFKLYATYDLLQMRIMNRELENNNIKTSLLPT